jgi:hypothetical protein
LRSVRAAVRRSALDHEGVVAAGEDEIGGAGAGRPARARRRGQERGECCANEQPGGAPHEQERGMVTVPENALA